MLTVDDLAVFKVYDIDFRKEIVTMYNVIVELGYADKMRNTPEDTIFMFSGGWCKDVSEHPKVLKCGHSGATEAICFQLVRQLFQGTSHLLKKKNE